MKIKEWCIALDNIGPYIDPVLGLRYKFLKGERATKEKVFNMIPGMTEEEYARCFRPATEEEINGEFEWDGEQYVLVKEKERMAKVDLELFICSLIQHFESEKRRLHGLNCIQSGHYINIICSLLKAQGLEYKDGVIVEIEPKKEESIHDPYSLPVGDDSNLPVFDESKYHPCTEKEEKSEQDTPGLTELEKAISKAIIGYMFLPKDLDHCVNKHIANNYYRKCAQEILSIARKQIAEEVDVDNIKGLDFDAVRRAHTIANYFEVRPFALECYHKGIEDVLEQVKKG